MDYRKKVTMDASGFVLLSDYVPAVIQEIRYFSTYNFVGERINGYEEPCAICTREAARARTLRYLHEGSGAGPAGGQQ